MLGTCRLHHGIATLRNSHVLPSWAFRRAQKTGAGRSQLVLLSNGVAVLSNDQHREYLLCAACEHLVSRWEDYVAQVSWQEDGSFPALTAATPATMLPDEDVLSVAALDTSAITCFALSVFWRASVCTRLPDFRLGPPYEDDMRLFLLGEAAFPAKARLVVSLLRPPSGVPITQVMTMPNSQRVDAHHRACSLLLFGMNFTLVLGDAPEAYNLLSFERTQLVFLSDGRPQADAFGRIGSSAARKGKLSKLDH